MISVHATKSRFTLWTAIALVAVIGVLWAQPQSALAAPDRPTGLTATALDHDTVSLTWSRADEENVDHYQILRRSADQGRLSQVATTQTTSFQDDGLQPETTYIYRVRAMDSEGALSMRSVKSETTTAAAPTITQVDPTPEPTPEHAQAKGDESDEQDQNATPRSSHTSLSALVLEDNNGAAITLRPTFAATTTEYRAAVKHNVSRITVTATAAAGATLEYLDATDSLLADADADTTGRQVDLLVGETVFKVKVTSGSDTEAYTVAVERDSARAFGWTPTKDITLDSANANAAGMWADGTTLWVSDSVDAKLYAYTLATGARVAASDITLHTDNANPTGIWSDGTMLLVADDTDDKVYAYTLATGVRVAGSDITLHADNAAPTGLWGTSTHLYVAENSLADNVGDRWLVYVYDRTTGARDTDKEFRLLGGNGRTTGLWSDGTTLWRTDVQFSEVTAYTLATQERDNGKVFRLASYRTSTLGATAIWSDGETVWTKENIAGGRLYSYKMLPATTGDTTLASLTVAHGTPAVTATLRPTFTFDTLTYRTAVPNSAAQVTITPTKNNTASTVTFFSSFGDALDDAATATGFQVDVAVGTTVVFIKVTSTNGDALTHTVIVERDSALFHGWTPTKDINGLFDAGSDRASGLTSNGTTMWVGDYTDNKLYAYTLATVARDASNDIDLTASPSHATQSLWSDSTTVWVGGHGGLYSYVLATGIGTVFSLDSGNTSRDGIWTDGTTMWVLDGTGDKVYAYALSDGTRQDGTGGTTNREFDLQDPNTQGTALWANGTTMWVANDSISGNIIYAYKMTTGTDFGDRDAAKDIPLHGNNRRPTGLWSDGTTLWVTDGAIGSSNNKVYSYNMPPAAAGNTSLTGITVSHGTPAVTATLRPTFTFDSGTYRVAVPNSAAQVTVTPTANSSGAAITIGGTTITSGSAHSVSVDVGVTTIEITLTSGSRSHTYALVIERDSDVDWGWTPSKDLNNLTAGNQDIRGFWGNATHFYVAHYYDDKINAYNRSDGSRAAGKDITLHRMHQMPPNDPGASNDQTRGIWSDGTTLWAVDYAEGYLYAYTLDGGAHDPDKEFDLNVAANAAIDAWGDGTTIWVSDHQVDRLRAYTLEGGAADSTKDITLASANTVATGIWSDGTTMWVTDFSGYHVYAYELSSGMRDGSQEFPLESDKGQPRALWADGTTMWVLPYGAGKKIYSYKMPDGTSTAPGAPTDLRATVSGNSQIDLAWTPPADNGGASISGYKIEVSLDGDSDWSNLVTDTGNADTTHSDTGLADDTTRHYRVSAININGTGPPSNVASATTTPTNATVPGAPSSLTATNDGQTTINLSWTAPADDGDSRISGYKIEISTDGRTNWSDLIANTLSSSTRYSDTGVSPGTTRHYRVSAINAVGTGRVSNIARATTSAAPGAPTNLTATANGTTRIDLSWTAPANRGTSSITGYRIEVSPNGAPEDEATNATSWSELVANTRSTRYSHTGLEPGTTRHYRVSAINSVGRGPVSNTANATAAPNIGQQTSVFEGFRLVNAGRNGQQESDTSTLINVQGAALALLPNRSNSINPEEFDDYPDDGTNDEKDTYIRKIRPGIAVKIASGQTVDRVQAEITFNYPTYPINGDVTTVFTDRGARTFYGACGSDPDNSNHYSGRANEWEQLNYEACDMLRYNGSVTVVLRAYDGANLIETVVLNIQVSNWLQR